ncbi:MAG: hypothetical protein P4L79_06845 [Legionella sp.]|uniref:hypothetical protein n=1 Tax=Legionella sp. TaxID=459 RepID=UPI002842EF6D|nr:hypothetical protein [Legionella sp.]
MATQLQTFVLGSNGNLWLETGPFGDTARTIATRQQIDANVTNLYSQVGENHVWRTGFQALNPGEIYVLGTDNNLWLEHAPFNSIPPSRIQIDANVETFQAIDLGTVFVLGTDGNLWLEHGPFDKIPPPRQQVDGNVLGFQVLDLNTVFVLGTDGNLWLEYGPFGQEIPPRRDQVDANVIQFWAMDQGTVYVLGNDLTFWYEPGPFGDLNIVTSNRTQIDANVNDFQPLRLSNDEGGDSRSGGIGDVVFILGHDGNLWLAQGPYAGVDHTVQTRQFVSGNVISFGAGDPANLFMIDGNLNLWQMTAPFGPENTIPVDGNVVACQPLFPPQQLIAMQRPIMAKIRH